MANPTACLLIIGNEVLSGRTKDANLQFLATRLGAGVMTYAMPIGFGVILFTVLITAIYVRRANGEYDTLTEQIAKAVLK